MIHVSRRRFIAAAALTGALFFYGPPADAAPKMAAFNSPCIKDFTRYVFANGPKAFALSEVVLTGDKRLPCIQACGYSWRAKSQQFARQEALAHCRRVLKKYGPKATSTCQVVNLK